MLSRFESQIEWSTAIRTGQTHDLVSNHAPTLARVASTEWPAHTRPAPRIWRLFANKRPSAFLSSTFAKARSGLARFDREPSAELRAWVFLRA